MKYIIGMDIGTTATKGVLYDLTGQKIAENSQNYPLIENELGQAEEDPHLIFATVQNIIFALSKQVVGKVVAISWSSQMHSLLGLDENHNLLTKSITWADNRAGNIVEQAKQSGLAEKIYQRTGMPMHPMAPVYKLLWLKQTRPELFARVKNWLGIKEYLIFRLTGQLVEDISMAAGTGLLNLQNQDWDKEILDKIRIKREQLPRLAVPTAIVAPIKIEYIQKLNLTSDTKLVLGASDGYLSTIGVGVVKKDSFALNVGTSGAVRTISNHAILDQKCRFFCYPASKKQFLLGSPVNNGGIVLDWARKALFNGQETTSKFLNIAQSVPAGSNGLIFHPYLGGERAPIWQTNACGSFVGLTRRHTKPQMARAVLEGIIMNLLEAAHVLTINTTKPEAIRATGGFLRTNFIRQLFADIFNVTIVTMKDDQSGTLAAMFLARLALGLNHRLSEINDFAKEDKTYYPNPKAVKVYQELIPLYEEVGHDLLSTYGKIAAFRTKHPQIFN